MAETGVVLNQNITAGATVATYTDSSSRAHQEMVVQTQSGASDPISVSTSNPLPVGGNIADGAADAGNSVKVGGVYNTSAPTLSGGQRSTVQLDSSGNLKVNIAAGAAAGGTSSTVGAAAPSAATAVGFTDGTNMQLGHVDGSGNLKVNIAAGGVPSAQDNSAFTPGTTNGLGAFAVFNDGIGGLTSGNSGELRCTVDRKLYVAIGAAVSGGWSPTRVLSAASTNSTSVKGSAGQIGSITVANNSASNWAYLKLYDSASAPTAGAGTPVFVVAIPPGGGNNPPLPGAIKFSSGIGFTITGGAADNDTTAVAAAQVVGGIAYA